jgi:hypothetical protein
MEREKKARSENKEVEREEEERKGEGGKAGNWFLKTG